MTKLNFKKLVGVLLVCGLLLALSAVAVFAQEPTEATVVSTEADLQGAIGTVSDVQLDADIALTAPIEIPVGAELTVDLAGHKIVSAGNAVDNKGQLAVIDTVGGGSLVAGEIAVVNNGSLVLGEVTLTAGTVALDNYASAVVNGATVNGKTTANGFANYGTLDVLTATVKNVSAAVVSYEGGRTVIDGGKFTALDNAILSLGGETTVNAGSFTSMDVCVRVDSEGVYAPSALSNTVTVNGGTFIGVTAVHVGAADGYKVEAYITDGTFTGSFDEMVGDDAHIYISGGKYDFYIDKSLCLEGYLCYPGGTGYIIAPTPIVVTTAEELGVALSCDYMYVMLGADIVLDEMITIPAGTEAILDLGGHTISVAESEGNHIYAFNNLGSFTITGSGAVYARGIYNGYNGVSTDEGVEGAVLNVLSGDFYALDANGGACVFNCAELFVNGGNFYGKTAAINNRLQGRAQIDGGFYYSENGYAVQNNGGELFIINGNVEGGFGGVGNFAGNTLIHGGSFANTNTDGGHVVYVGEGKLDVHGGYFYDGVESENIAEYTIYAAEGTEVFIQGGNFVGMQNIFGKVLFAGKGEIMILGGDFSGDLYAKSAEWCATVSGGTFDGEIAYEHCADGFISNLDPLTQRYTVAEEIGTVKSMGVGLGSTFHVLYYVYIDASYTAEDYALVVTLDGIIDRTVTLTAISQAPVYEGGELVGYDLTFEYAGVVPNALGNKITATLVNTAKPEGFKVTADHVSSIAEYIEKVGEKTADDLGYTEEQYAALHALLDDIITYGAASQAYTNYTEYDKVGSDVTEDWVELEGSLALPEAADTYDRSAYFTAANVVFDVANGVKVKFKTDDIDSVRLHLTAYGADVDVPHEMIVDEGNGVYSLSVNGIYAIEFDVDLVFSLYTDEVLQQTLTYSVNDYVFAKQNSEDAALRNLVRALYKYGESADAYYALVD